MSRPTLRAKEAWSLPAWSLLRRHGRGLHGVRGRPEALGRGVRGTLGYPGGSLSEGPGHPVDRDWWDGVEAFKDERWKLMHSFPSSAGRSLGESSSPLRRQRTAILVDRRPVMASSKRNELIHRLVAGCCEICEAEADLHVHHIRKLADLNRPDRRPRPTRLDARRGQTATQDACGDRVPRCGVGPCVGFGQVRGAAGSESTSWWLSRSGVRVAAAM